MNPATLIGATATRLTRRGDAGDDWPGQSLAEGAAGVALLHTELAAAGVGDWDAARAWLRQASASALSVEENAGLDYGAPAMEFVVRTVVPYLPGFSAALARLEAATDGVIRDRLSSAALRRSNQVLPTLREFDLIRGLTGLGAVLLTRGPSTPLLGEVLSYLVVLTEPVQFDFCGIIVITGVDDDAAGWADLSLGQVDAILLRITGRS